MEILRTWGIYPTVSIDSEERDGVSGVDGDDPSGRFKVAAPGHNLTIKIEKLFARIRS